MKSPLTGVIFLRSNDFEPDPRVEKEALTLKEFGWDVQLLGWARNSQEGLGLRTKSGLVVHRSRMDAPHGSGLSNLVPLIGFQLFLLWNLVKKRKQFDVIHACNLDTGLAGLFAARLLRKKLVYDIFDFYVDAFPVPRVLRKLTRFLEVKVINSSDVTIICTEERAEQIAPAKPKNLIIIHNTPMSKSIEARNFNGEKLKIGFVGSLTQGRFLDEILQITESNSDLEFHIAGFGEFSSKFESASITSNNLHFYGKVNYDDGLAISKGCDLMIAMYDPSIPNHQYSAPNKFYESLFIGTPLLVAKGSGVDKLVNENNTGFVIEYSAAAFIDFIRKHSVSTIRKFRTDHFDCVYSCKYSWTEMSRRLKLAYEDLFNL